MLNVNFWIMFLSGIINVYVLAIIFKKVTCIKHKFTISDYFIILIFSFLISFNNIYNTIFYKALITVFLTVIMYKMLYKKNNAITVFYGLVICILSIMMDFVVGIMLSIFVKDYSLLNTLPLIKFLYSTFYAYVLYFLFMNKKLFFLINKIKENLNINGNVFFYLFFILFFINIVYCLYSINFLDFKYYITIFIFLIVVLVFNYIYFNTVYNNKLLNIKNKYLELNIENNEKSIEDYRLLKHNLMNDLIKIKCTSPEDITKIIDETIKKYDKATAWVNKLKNIPYGIQGIIFAKSNLAEQHHLKIFVDNQLKVKKFNNKAQIYFDVCDILSVCLDNAIEASIESNDKIIYINLYKIKENTYRIEIINTFVNEIDIDKIGNKEYSTKNRNSGLGLYYIEHLNPKVKIKKHIINNLFKISLTFSIK